MTDAAYANRICYHYATEPDVKMRIAHGVWGGVNPHGEIEMCFYDEAALPPEQAEQQIGADGMPGEERPLQPNDSRQIGRSIHTRILLNYNTARAVLDWLESRLSELETEAPRDIYDPEPGIKQ